LIRAQTRSDRHRILCGFPPGGPVDIICRKVAERMTARSGASVVVENKVGASGRLAVTELIKAPADGTTMLVTAASIVTLYPHLYKQLAYDVFADLAPVSTVASTAFALAVGSTVPDSVQSVPDLVRWSSARGPVGCGNSGMGSMQHFLASIVARETGLQITHVPYRGGAASMQAAAAGEVPAALGTESAARALVQAGKLRVLATTGVSRSSIYPQAPTFAEHGWPALAQREWFGAFLPGQTPQSIVERTAALMDSIMGEPEIRETWERQSLAVDSVSLANFKTAIRREFEFWGPIIRASGFTPES
jgi:tripartite-type tricarboxylate transporter receptor subunit TctC